MKSRYNLTSLFLHASEKSLRISTILRSFFKSAQDSGFLPVWEPRGDWSHKTIKALCTELDLIHCVDPFEKKLLHGKPQYCRLHGGPRYQHRYTEEELRWLKDKLGDKETYVLFNNISMYKDALTFARMTGTR